MPTPLQEEFAARVLHMAVEQIVNYRTGKLEEAKRHAEEQEKLARRMMAQVQEESDGRENAALRSGFNRGFAVGVIFSVMVAVLGWAGPQIIRGLTQ